ncbi:MAG: hypothetical protein MO846_08840 [Candidatus Devosia symbiotica]|nr:hypothetical protein [Candidatus Devosia symbiotica]
MKSCARMAAPNAHKTARHLNGLRIGRQASNQPATSATATPLSISFLRAELTTSTLKLIGAVVERFFHYLVTEHFFDANALVLGARLDRADHAAIVSSTEFFGGRKAAPEFTLDIALIMGRAHQFSDAYFALKHQVVIAKADSVYHQLAQFFWVGEGLRTLETGMFMDYLKGPDSCRALLSVVLRSLRRTSCHRR